MNEEIETKKIKPYQVIITVVVIIQFFIIGSFFKDPIIEFVKAYLPSEEVSYDYPLQSIHVNLADEGSRHFLKTQISLSGTLEDGSNLLNENESQIRATIVELLRGKKLDEINTVEMSKQLQQEILEKVNQVVGLNVIDEVYLVEFLYQ
ncbi:MAG: flagellar basal body-associated FliL family protein [Turicibacter sp.]